jgi:hypothetical protein
LLENCPTQVEPAKDRAVIRMYIETGTIELQGYRHHQFAGKYTDPPRREFNG